ncbi:putative voltage-gated potassium channel subunit beta [Phytophthora citrophthora]|uniref:Voltage-gated potassium channel subunit beta n=1 Tax=Phytophthora citrophthora TaxID=4793 RepID=A0AAD9G9H3_9STRA|nr:putative voltage-gated potassium channel subunit beta [Phytophthora citrophthora]
MGYNDKFTVDAWLEMVKTAFEHGVNFYDMAEELLSVVEKKGIIEGVRSREELVTSTKIFCGTNNFTGGPNNKRNTRKHLVEGLKASLKRLDLEYVGVVFCTTLSLARRSCNRTRDKLHHRARLGLLLGTSNWSSSEILEACDCADRLGLIRPIVVHDSWSSRSTASSSASI